jgi:hypothetical protein
MITIINCHAEKGGEYIGRPSILGNPFILGVDGTRTEVIAKYEVYFYEQLEINEKFRLAVERLIELARTGDLKIACWCSPMHCHGDVIKKYIEQRLNEERRKKLFKKI